MPLAIAPKIATPRALPMDLEKRLVPVTTPRSFHCTLACAAMRLGVATSPMPSPTTKQLVATRAMLGDWLVRASTSVPVTATAMPISAVVRKPMRRYSLPDSEAAMGHPMVSAASARPATSGGAPTERSR